MFISDYFGCWQKTGTTAGGQIRSVTRGLLRLGPGLKVDKPPAQCVRPEVDPRPRRIGVECSNKA